MQCDQLSANNQFHQTEVGGFGEIFGSLNPNIIRTERLSKSVRNKPVKLALFTFCF